MRSIVLVRSSLCTIALVSLLVDMTYQDAMDDAGETPENMEALKTVVMERLGEWYMRNHGVGTMANVEDMCTLLQVRMAAHNILVVLPIASSLRQTETTIRVWL